MSEPEKWGDALRKCEHCGQTLLVHGRRGEWALTRCPNCGRPYERPITLGLDTVENPSAPAWPSGETLQKERDAKWDKFIHPAKK